ncbi:MAG: phage holin family protein [Oscillospiraceae bacterium]|nr:phage holin family protein [Oscillospiraceae bacterium]
MKPNLQHAKAAFAAAAGLLTARLGILAVPVYLLAGANVMDYITGLLAAPFRAQVRSSRTGIKGIAKKIAMWLLVAIGIMLDILLAYVAQTLNVGLPVNFALAALVCLWLLANEIISVLENIGDMGVDVPFLMPLVKWVRTQAETAATTTTATQEEK